MDWREKLKAAVGVADDKAAADLNDMEGREVLNEQHLAFITRSGEEES